MKTVVFLMVGHTLSWFLGAQLGLPFAFVVGDPVETEGVEERTSKQIYTHTLSLLVC